MPDLTAKRTLVKSPPELWDELSEVEGLAKHLGAFGEIKITKLEPEHTVAWEGEHASGTVSIEPSGWGTKVTLHAELPEEPAAEAEEPAAEAPIAEPEAEEPIADEPEPIVEPEEPEAEQPVAEQPLAEEPAPEAPTADELIAEEPVADEEPQPARQRRGFWGWLFRTRTGGAEVAPEPVAVEPEPEEAEPVAVEPAPEPEPEPEEAEPVAVEPAPEPEPEPVAAEPEPEPVGPEYEGSDPLDAPAADDGEDPGGLTPADEETEPAVDPERARAILDEALDALGAAHHRPFSRG